VTVEHKFGEGNVVEVRFGACSPKLRDQLRRFRVRRAELARLQKVADAITMLWLHNVIPQSAVDRARTRLWRQISEACASRK
jgi:5'-deoxynucleotidase YfbR-like HD superfamily hydrolase